MPRPLHLVPTALVVLGTVALTGCSTSTEGAASSERSFYTGAPTGTAASTATQGASAAPTAPQKTTTTVSDGRSADVPTPSSSPSPTTSGGVELRLSTTDEQAEAAAGTLLAHGKFINAGKFAEAYNLFTPTLQKQMVDVPTWSRGLQSAAWTRLDVRSSSGSLEALQLRVDLSTRQDAEDGRDGQTCSVWPMTYTVADVDGTWKIHKVKMTGEGPTPCS